jgi:tRNA pseudouridine55 synthase
MNGIIKIDKPSGITSHDVVNIVRKISSVKQVGHAGTLDPFATGLLIVGIGNGTRILEYFLHAKKTYDVIARIGLTTDTYDKTGKTVEENSCDRSEEEIRETLLSFVGDYDQVPPIYSSKKYAGVRLYKLARSGKIITMPPVRVKIHSIEIESIKKPYVKFKTVVSGGTYIRSLCRDFGIKLGCGAIAQELRRIQVDRLDLSDCVDIQRRDNLDMSKIMSLEEVTRFMFKTVVVNDLGSKKIEDGRPIGIDDVTFYEDFNKGELVRILDKNGKLISISLSERKSSFFSTIDKAERKDIVIRPKKVFRN